MNLKCNASDPPLPRSIPRPLSGTASSERGLCSYRRNGALSTGVQSDRGFVVQSMDRFTIEYREEQQRISAYVERGLEGGNACVFVKANEFECWDDPPGVPIARDKQTEIIANFIAGLEFQGLVVHVG